MIVPFKYQPVEEISDDGTWWVVKNLVPATCAQIDYQSHDDYSGRLTVQDGFRWCEYRIQTKDNLPPNFEFVTIPGGDGNKDSINLNDCCVNNIISSELIDLSEGGCFGDVQWPSDIDDEVMADLDNFVQENGYASLEFEKGWNLDETEVWIWGVIEITDNRGSFVKKIVADKDGNLKDFIEQIDLNFCKKILTKNRAAKINRH